MRGRLTCRGFGRAIVSSVAIGGWLLLGGVTGTSGAQPDPQKYWEIRDVKPGMKGVGKTVMVGTRLEEFEAEVLGVLRDVSPGRDMILVRLKGCNLEHAGIVQGMSGSPIYLEGKLLGAVAYAWEFAKDPIAGVTPFAQMVEYVKASDRRVTAQGERSRVVRMTLEGSGYRDAVPMVSGPTACSQGQAVSGGGLGGMRPIATPLSARGLSPRAMALLGEHLAPWNMAPASGGGALEEIIAREGDKPLQPGSPMSVALVTGDFDLSGIGTVTHVEGDRVYGFGHPMMGLGACELPLMTGYIHTVYPRASVSMKMGSPLKTIGVLDADVSTAVSGRIGAVPDMIPMEVTVKTGSYAEPRTYKVKLVREPNLVSSLVMTVLTSAIDTEGNLPEELTATLDAEIAIEGREPIKLHDVLSGARYTGPMGASALFGPISSMVGLLVKNPFEPVRLKSISAKIQVEEGRIQAQLEQLRLRSERYAPGETLRAVATLVPFQGERAEVELSLELPADLPEGTYELTACDLTKSLQRRFRNEPHRLEPQDLNHLVETLRYQAAPSRKAVYVHLPRPERGVAVEGQALPNLPGSLRSVFQSNRRTAVSVVKSETIEAIDTRFVVEGNQSVKFTVVRDPDVALRSE